jgi:flagellar motility protein MotE (MotC chaperone)
MKIILMIISLILISISGFAQNNEKNKESKLIYSKKDFMKKVKEGVEKEKKTLEKQLKKIKEEGIVKISFELLEKEKSIESKVFSLNEEKKKLDKYKKEIDLKIVELDKIQMTIIGCVNANKSEESQRVNRVASIISGMKPIKAAEILSVQESKIAVKLLSIITPLKASKIFNLMDKEISARLQKQYMNMRK